MAMQQVTTRAHDTDLLTAASAGDLAGVISALDAGADPSARDGSNKSAYRLAMEAQEYEVAMLVGDAHCDKIMRDQRSRRRVAGYELRPISPGDRLMVDMTRAAVGGRVSRLYLVLEDDTRVNDVLLVDELVLEVPLPVADRKVKAVGVPFEQF